MPSMRLLEGRTGTNRAKECGGRDKGMKDLNSGNGGKPLCSIGDVVELLRPDYPSITASSLRFLERIGLVVPERTPGGHRLYGPEDIALIRTIKRLQDHRYTLEEIADRLRPRDNRQAIDLEDFLAQVLAGDAAGATHQVTAGLDRGLTPQELFDIVFSPVLQEIGDRWAAGTITVAQEHTASEVIRDLVGFVGASQSGAHDDGPVIVAAAVAEEHHIIGLQMLTTLLRLRGFQAHFLGADVDPEFLVDAVLRNHPDVVLLTATIDDHLPAAEAAIVAVKNADSSEAPAIVVGGQITRRHADHLTSLGAAVVRDEKPGAAAEQVQRMMTNSNT